MRKVIDGKWDYTCCKGENSDEKCGDWQFMAILAVCMLTLGLTGTLALTVALHHQTSIAQETEEDRLLQKPTIQNGAVQHRTVPQSRWCLGKVICCLLFIHFLGMISQLIFLVLGKFRFQTTNQQQGVSPWQTCNSSSGWFFRPC